MQWVESAEVFIGARKLRNLLVHEYMSDTQLFLHALSSAREAAEMLFRTVAAIETEAIDVTIRSIERNLQKLQDEKRLRRIGPAKGGHWQVITHKSVI